MGEMKLHLQRDVYTLRSYNGSSMRTYPPPSQVEAWEDSKVHLPPVGIAHNNQQGTDSESYPSKHSRSIPESNSYLLCNRLRYIFGRDRSHEHRSLHMLYRCTRGR